MRKWLHLAAVGLAAFLVCAIASPEAAAQSTDSGAGTPAAGETGGQAPAANPDTATLGFFKNTELGGLVDVYYDYYSTKPTGDALLRNFDTKHNAFSFSMAEIWLTKTPTADSRTGFKLKLNFGPATTNIIHASEPGTAAVFQHIQEAYGSYLAPAGKGLQFDAGIFVTHNGAEVIEAKDDWNYSRSLLFSWAIPYYHSGVRVTYPANDKVTLAGGVVNGWNNVVDNNTGKTAWGQVVLKPVSALSIVENYTGGPEQTTNNDDWRHLTDTVVTYTATPMLSLMANYDYGRDKVSGATVHWQGIAGYLKYQANKWVAVIPRGEWFDDPQGFTTGTAQTLKSATVTLELKPTDNFLWRIEYRGDYSNIVFFKDDAGKPQKNQHSIVFGVLYSFSSKTP